MTGMNAGAWAWVLDPHDEALRSEFIQAVPGPARWIGLQAIFLSYALAETIIGLPQPGSLKTVAPFTLLIANFFLPQLVLGSVLFVFHQITRLAGRQSVPFTPWITLSMVALFPLHLLLPLAMICRPLGPGGILLYALVECGILLVVLQRWTRGIQRRYQWPAWAALLVVLSPLILGAFALFMATAFLMGSMALIAVGLLR